MSKYIKVGSNSGSSGSSTFDGLSDKASVDLPGINTPLANALSGKEVSTNKKTDVDANKTSDTFFPTVKAVFDWVSGLFVKGAASSTDNAIARFDGTTGKLVQNSSAVVITDNNLMGIGTLTPMAGTGISNSGSLDVAGYLVMANNMGLISRNVAGNNATTIARVSATDNTEIFAFGGKNIVFMAGAKFNGALIDNAGSAGTDGQVLKKVGGQVLWANP